MANRVKGTVFRAGKSKFGFYVKLDGDDTFYNTKYEPKCSAGDVVGIEYNQSGKSRNITKLVVLGKGEPPAPRGGNGASYQAGGDRQDSIVWQSAQQRAIQAADLLLSNGAVKLPKTENDRAVIIAGLVDQLTYKFFKDASDPKASKAYKDAAGVQEDAQEPEGDEWESPAEEAPWEDESPADEVVWD